MSRLADLHTPPRRDPKFENRRITAEIEAAWAQTRAWMRRNRSRIAHED